MGKFNIAVLTSSILIRRQMTRSRISLRESQPASGESEDDSSDAKSPDAKSPAEEQTPSRGRRSQPSDGNVADMMDTKS